MEKRSKTSGSNISGSVGPIRALHFGDNDFMLCTLSTDHVMKGSQTEV